jgi:hypothetical protein
MAGNYEEIAVFNQEEIPAEASGSEAGVPAK